jgi:hypothetical protein
LKKSNESTADTSAKKIEIDDISDGELVELAETISSKKTEDSPSILKRFYNSII